MTVGELAERITVDELAEWAVISQLDTEEREDRRKRVEIEARVRDGANDARSRLRARRA